MQDAGVQAADQILSLVMQVLALVFSGVSIAGLAALAYNFGRRAQRQDRTEKDLNDAWDAIRLLGGAPRSYPRVGHPERGTK